MIFVRARGTNVATATPDGATHFCLGYVFDSNTFTHNIGCSQKAGGVLRFECVNDGASPATNDDRYNRNAVTVASYCSAANNYVDSNE